jgi:SulP family sulfate permease
MVSFLYRCAHPRIMEVGQHQDGTFRDRIRFNLPRLAPDVLAVRLDFALNFLTAAMLEWYISKRIHADTHIRRVLLCAGSINDIDVSGIETLEALQRTLQDKGLVLHMSAIKKQVWDVLDQAGVIKTLGSERIFATYVEASSQCISTFSAPARRIHPLF